jgi:mono/diheme cytochrome c family protein
MGQLVLIVVFGAVAAAAAFLALRTRPPSNDRRKDVPPAMRPADIDQVLESDRLTKILLWGALLTIFFAFFMPAYWFREPARMAAKEESFDEESIDRGKIYFALTTDPETGESNLRGKECARCHGNNAEGGTNPFFDPNTGQMRIVNVPELQSVFARYEEPPEGYEDARAFIRETIDRGRPGTDMPTWGNKFGGPLTEQEIDDIVNWLRSIQQKVDFSAEATGDQIFSQLCATCHGPGGSGGSGPPMTGGSETRQFPNIEDHKNFVRSGSKSGQPYGTSGMGTGGMPPWPQLKDDQLQKVVDYERSL